MSSNCWNCDNIYEGSLLFCSNCANILPLKEVNYFNLFELSIIFQINETSLDTKYTDLQKLSHPDKFIHKSKQEQFIALQNIMFINQAYQTLKSPLSRAEHLLFILTGEQLQDHDIVTDPAILHKELERREILEEISDILLLQDLLEQADIEKFLYLQELNNDFVTKSFNIVKNSMIKLRYLEKFISEIIKKQSRASYVST